MQVVGVAEHDRRAESAQLGRVDGLDGGLRADGHEGRRRHVAMRSRQDPGAGGAVCGGDPEAHLINIASPKE